MSEHRAAVRWKRTTESFSYPDYNREHTWEASGHVVAASAAPKYLGKPDFVDPEEAFVASLACCHMLTFLAIASRKGFMVDRYEDDALGIMASGGTGKLWITQVILRPRVAFGGDSRPTWGEVDAMHHQSHEDCFLANSVKTAITVEAQEL